MVEESIARAAGLDGAGRGAAGLLRIADAARAVGVSPSALRLWERQGLVVPIRNGGRERRYGPDEMTRLRCIRRLRVEEGLNAPGIRRALGETGAVPVAGPGGDSGSGLGAGPSTAGPAAPVSGRGSVPESPAGEVGARLRSIRNAAGLSLREVGARTGLSASFLSGLERGTSGVSLATLIRLAGTYGTSVATILGSEAPADARSDEAATADSPPPRVVRADARSVMDPGRGIRIEELATRPARLQPHLVVLAPGATSDGAYDHAGEEFIFVLAGRLVVWLDERECHELAPGDALTFPSSLSHRFVALGRDETHVLWVNTPPTL